MIRRLAAALLAFAVLLSPATAQEPEVIFKKSTVWKFLTPDDKLAVYGVDDPVVEGVACHYTLPEKGGVKGMFGVADEVSEISLACRQVGPITFGQPLKAQQEVFSERMSLLFKRLRVVRMVDAPRNTLVYLTYSEKLIDGSPQNAITAVPIDRATPIPLKP